MALTAVLVILTIWAPQQRIRPPIANSAQGPVVKQQQTGSAILDHEYLEIRAKLLQLAASFDRMERANQTAVDQAVPTNEPRKEQIEQGLHLLLDAEPDKAQRIQLLFSNDYAPSWRDDFKR